MRSGACAVQQTLTAEAASVLKHSLGLARRRGHAQITPLHVAATLLSSRASSFRRACLKSQPHQTSHPLHCRALELCFNVALNRLPTTVPGPLLHAQPSLSNALVAALKRAQAHQRRGCIEQQQQQPLLTIKVELEHLIISILDDPSVSRVMREAGFSSTTVKNNIEDCSSPSVFQCYNTSGGIFSSPSSPSPPQSYWQTRLFAYSTADHNPVLFSTPKRIPISHTTDQFLSFKDDIKLVLDIFLRKNGNRKNTVLVGDSLSITEGLVAELKGKCERGELHEELKVVQFIKFPFAPVPLKLMKREQVELNLSQLKTKLDSLTYGGGGAIIYTGDLKWTVDIATQGEKERDDEIFDGYNPVDHVVAELGRWVRDYEDSNSKIWLMAAATYQTYMRCQMRQPSLETQWALQAVPVRSSGGLGLSLHVSSVQNARIASPQNPSCVPELKPFGGKEEADTLTCCEQCASNYEKEAQLFKPVTGQDKLLPAWLQSHAAKTHRKDELMELRKKWNRLCHSLHRRSYSQTHLSSSLYNNQCSVGKNYSTSSYNSYPLWTPQNTVFHDSGSISFGDLNFKHAQSLDLVHRFGRQRSCTLEFNSSSGIFENEMTGSSLDSLNSSDGKEVTMTLALGNSVLKDSGKMVEMKTERTMQRVHTCRLLQDNVPWQSETIPSIAEALIDSRSAKQNITWLLIRGNDFVGKRRLACAIAESVFGSADLLFHLNMKKKDPALTPYSELLSRALKSHEKLVVVVEDVELADPQFKKFLADGHEGGKLGEIKGLSAIFILTQNDSKGYGEQQNLQEEFAIKLTLKVKITKHHLDTRVFGNKRKAECELLTRIKNLRTKENDETLGVENCRRSKKDFLSRKSSFSINLDLNIRADEDYGGSEDESEDNSPNSSDLTREYMADDVNANSFLDIIENKFVFDISPARDREMTEVFMSKIKRSFEQVYGNQQLVNFSIEDGVLKEVLSASGFFTNNLFEKWLKDIFQTSLQMANLGGKERGIEYKLCLGGKEDRILKNGFMGSCLPTNVQVTYMD